jgi:hypothetical protein
MRTLLSIFIFTYAISLEAQSIRIGSELFTGKYNLQSLRKYQQLNENHYIPFKTIQNFPSRAGGTVFGTVRLNDFFSTGIFAGFLSTGSRMHYADFTGSATRDIFVHGIQIGSTNRFEVYSFAAIDFNIRFSLGAVFNSIIFENKIDLIHPEYQEYERSQWTSTNFLSRLGFEISRDFRRIGVLLFAEYEINSPGDLKRNGSQTMNEGPTSGVTWDGVRAGMGITYNFCRSK